MVKVLITGGAGLVGQQLSRALLNNGYEVAILSSRKSISNNAEIPSYYWNIDQNEIDRDVLNSCECIIHLAGANIGAKRWTDQRKRQILGSRIKSAELIFDNLDQQNHQLKTFISASAIGYYGSVTSDRIFDETDSSAKDFLGKTCAQWEQAADRFEDIGVRVVKVRTGIVLSEQGGLLPRFSVPVKLGLAAAFGSGKQFMPWIHIKDLCNIYLCAIENSKITGAYNAVAPDHITNKDFNRKMARRLRRPFWLPNIPSSIIKLLFGELSVMLLNGSRVSPAKIISADYEFCFASFDEAIEDLIKH